ncbi:MAG: DegV family protein, partial [Tenericutes bacterium HGW-Tenericutes-6]
DLNHIKKGSPLFVLPLRIIIDGKEFVDKKDITLKEVLSKLDDHQVTTSLPSPKDILDTLDEIKKQGYTHVICIPISKGLSGTMNIIKQITETYEGLTIEVIDTKNISMGSGYSSVEALELIEKNMSFNEVVKAINERLSLKKVFFTVEKLTYLKKGGRIGLVAATVAELLKIKPVITCNENGIYYTVKKERGYQRAVKQLIEQVKIFADQSESYDITLLNSNTILDLDTLIKNIKESLPHAKNVHVSNITPALAIHTGSEALGIAISLK